MKEVIALTNWLWTNTSKWAWPAIASLCLCRTYRIRRRDRSRFEFRSGRLFPKGGDVPWSGSIRTRDSRAAQHRISNGERRNSDPRKKCVPVWQIAVEFLQVAVPFPINQFLRFGRLDRKSTRLNSSHEWIS